MRTTITIVCKAAVLVLVLGTLVLLAGAALLVLPGPGWQFPWAARLLARAQAIARSWWARVRAGGSRTPHQQHTAPVNDALTEAAPLAAVARPAGPAPHVPSP